MPPRDHQPRSTDVEHGASEPESEGATAPAGRAVGEGLKQAIFDEALRLLESEGFSGLSTRKIASRVGCTATSIYLYFDNKDALVHALIAEGFERMDERLTRAHSAVTDSGGDPRAAIRAGARAFIDFALENPEFYEVMFLLRFDQLERYPAPLYRRARATLDRVIAGSALALEKDLLRSTTLLASLHGLAALLLHKRVDASVDADRLIETTLDAAIDAALPVGDSGESNRTDRHP
ncbi:MAG: TetR/AcrR family transcriptional regulator [Planctomycetota bacterium]